MDVAKVIVLIPQLLLLFVPGYIALSIQTKYLPKKRPDNFDATWLSILYSFIVGIAFELLRMIKNVVLPNKVIVGDGSLKHLVFLLLGVVLGFILTKVPNNILGKKISSVFNKNLDANIGVWETAMRQKEGAWVIVYLKNGMIYRGELRDFTDDPNTERKELQLYDYTLFVKNENKTSLEDEFSFLVEEGQANDRVYLQREDIIAIQIRPSNSEHHPDVADPT